MITSETNAFINVKDFGAAADGETLDTEAIQRAIDRCNESGGGTVVFPPGTYFTGSILLRSNIRVYVGPGATIKASDREEDFPECDHTIWGAKRPRSLFYGRGLDNVSVVGSGIIDGSGMEWWRRKREDTLRGERPHMIGFIECRNLLLRDFTCQNSPTWTIRPTLCEDVVIDNLRVINPYHAPNTDGINPDSCRNVRIMNCLVDVGDDCITLKSGTENDVGRPRKVCENITVTNCTLVHGHGGVVVGSEIHGSVRRIAISNCIFDGTDRGIRIKAKRGRGGVVEDISASNLVMHDVGCAVTINLHYGPHQADKTVELPDTDFRPADASTPRFRDIRFANINVRNARGAAAFLCGLPESPLENLSFESVTVILNCEPDNAGARPADACGLTTVKGKGILGKYLKSVYFRNVEVRNVTSGSVFHIEKSEGVLTKNK